MRRTAWSNSPARSPTLTNCAPHASCATRGERGRVGEGGQVAQRDAHRCGPADRRHHLGQDARRRRTERSLARILDVDDVGAPGQRSARLVR